MTEAFAVGAQRRVIVHTTRHVGPMARQDLAPRRLFEIEDAERLARSGDDARGLLAEHALLKETGDAAQCGDVGAGGDELQKLAACLGGRVVHAAKLTSRYGFSLRTDTCSMARPGRPPRASTRRFMSPQIF